MSTREELTSLAASIAAPVGACIIVKQGAACSAVMMQGNLVDAVAVLARLKFETDRTLEASVEEICRQNGVAIAARTCDESTVAQDLRPRDEPGGGA